MSKETSVKDPFKLTKNYILHAISENTVDITVASENYLGP